ncbi:MULTISPECIES: homoserine O-succinyltransferase [unclassified Streptomyces]|uniref:homoserine O-succinyltransferase n=1 Tax=unclassified Streptomyces TaxID=2593676 RepID=UPI002E78A395|nr:MULTISPECIES: homoserine O-succinyltransferase [unclassified Streptomyces]MEE1762425.1 homoserine O-succinyltransferase [Streptomyces sp. SP18BB07]MEE1829588.1 homoserine O-succinyltransferase [Streptomyces sp. SP17KL33]
MTLIVPTPIDAVDRLAAEGITVTVEPRDAAPATPAVELALLNLMPDKPVTETQVLRQLSGAGLPVRVTLLRPRDHVSRSTPEAYLKEHYLTHEDVADRRFDALIVTGAAVELLPFEEVTYWDELRGIMDWAQENVTSAQYVCWGAQAALYHRYGIPKHELPAKLFGSFPNRLTDPSSPLLADIEPVIAVPQSRHTENLRADFEKTEDLRILVESPEAGVHIAVGRDGRELYVSGHPEYDPDTLLRQYRRDAAKGADIALPAHYFPGDDPSAAPVENWQAPGRIFYRNWLRGLTRDGIPLAEITGVTAEKTGV